MQDSDLPDGDVTIAVDYSTVNYKDGFAVSGSDRIVKQFPLTPGIDLAGIVEASSHPLFHSGDRVVLNGYGIGEKHDGGFAQKARVSGDWLVKIPSQLSTLQAAAIGTAGYTAMLSVLALERSGLTPGAGDVLVTGAAGGGGSIAIAVLSRLGYRVIASTGRQEEADYLKALGAAEIIDRKTLSEPGPPLGKERWIGAIDAAGSHTLANVLAQTRYDGVVAAYGLAQGLDLPGSVIPFITRGVTLIGIDSVYAAHERRVQAWTRLARDLDLQRLEQVTSMSKLDEVVEVAARILRGKVRGRVVIDVNA